MQGHIVKKFDAEITKLNKEITAMAKSCEDQIACATKALHDLDYDLAREVIKKDIFINQFQKQIQDACVSVLVKRQPMAKDLRHLLSVLRITSELERIGDYAANIAKRVTRLSDISLTGPVELIIEMGDICREMTNDVMDAFLEFNTENSIAVWQRDDEIDKRFSKMMSLTNEQMQNKSDNIENSTQMIFMGKCCERIGDHITNIAEDVFYMVTGQNYTGSL